MRKFTLLLLIWVSWTAAFGAAPDFNTDYKSPAYVFRLNNQMTDEIHSHASGRIEVSEELFSKLVEDNMLVAQFNEEYDYDFYNSKRRVDSMAPGNYLLARLYGKNIYYGYHAVPPFQIAMGKDYKKLSFFLHDSLNHILPDAEVSINGEAMPYNAATQRYEATKHYDRARVRVLHQGKLCYFIIDKEGYNWKIQKRRPPKFIAMIGRVVTDPVACAKEKEPVGYLAKLARLTEKISDRIEDYEDNEYEYRNDFKEYYNYYTGRYLKLYELRYQNRSRYCKVMEKCVRRDRRHNRKLTYQEEDFLRYDGKGIKIAPKIASFSVVGQPKYKPNDTVRVKESFYRKNRRYNRPISVSLSQDYNGSYYSSLIRKNNRKVLKERLDPCADGVYTYDFVLADSLQLQLDEKYYVSFWDRKGRLLGYNSFKYEDYVLRDATLEGSYDQPDYYKGDSIRVKVTAKDANGLPFADALVKVTLQLMNVDSLLEARSCYSKELAAQNKMTDGKDELTFAFPPSVAGGNNISFRAEITLSMPDGNVEEKKLSWQQYYTEKHGVVISLNRDSLSAVAQYNGKDTVGRASVFAEDAFGNRIHLADTMLPCTMRVEPSYAAYCFKMAHASAYEKIPSSASMVSVQWRESGDSLFPMVSNALHLPMACYVIKDGEVIFTGSDKDLPAYYPWDKEKSYILRSKVLWAGQVMEYTDIVRVHSKQQLHIAVDEPSVIVPGMSCEMEVQVTDADGKPVKGADVTAYAINGQFNEKSPIWNYPNTYLDVPQVDYSKTSTSNGNAYINGSKLLSWKRISAIDTIVAYPILYPRLDTIHRYSYYPEDSLTQISPLICSSGYVQDIDVAYIDDVPCFIMSEKTPFSFAITPNEYHRIRLRTKTAEYTIDSVKVEANKRTILSFDVNTTSPLVKREERRKGLTKKEMKQLKPYIMLFERPKSFPQERLVREDGTLLHFNRTYKKGCGICYFAGPILDSVRWMSDSFDVKKKLDHNLVYSYDTTTHRLVTRPVTKKDYPQLRYRSYSKSLRGELLTLERMLREEEKRKEKIVPKKKKHVYALQRDYPQEKESGNYLRIRSDKPGSFCVLVPYEDGMPAVTGVRQLDDIKAGLYRVYLLNEDTTCYRLDSVKVEPNKRSFVRFDTRKDRIMTDSFACRLRSHLFYTEDSLDLAGGRLFVFLWTNDPIPSVAMPDSIAKIWEEFGPRMIQDRTGAVAQVSSVPLGPAASVEQALAGRLSGVRVTAASGQPGGASSATIRGLSSLSGSSEPLYVVDGKPIVGSALASINPSDIISMEVLKDAAATAIYGARAAHGVLVIKTKHGSDDSPVTEETEGGATLRTHFSDQGFWQPVLTTDKEGKARFSVTFPDNITRWQTIYLADAPIHKHIASGSVEGSIKSFVPLSARLFLPEFLVRGDLCLVRGKLTNYTQDTVQLTSSFSVNDSLISTHSHHCATTLTDTLKLRAKGDTLSVVYQFVSENHFNDGEKRKVKIMPQGVACTDGRFAILRDTLRMSFQSAKADSVTVRVMSTQSDLLQDEVSMLTKYPYGCNEQTTSKLIGFMTANQNPNLTKHQRKANEKKIAELVQTLEERQLPNGLWGWWVSDQSSHWISRYIVETLQKYNIDFPKDNMIKTCRELIKENHSSADKLFGLAMLHSLGEKLDYQTMVSSLDTVKDFSFLDSLDLAELKAKCGMPIDYEWLNKHREETMKGCVYYKFGNDRSVHSNRMMNTLQVYRILQADSLKDSKEEMQKIRDYFYNEKTLSRTSHWHNTYESAMILRTLSDDLKQSLGEEKKKVRFSGAMQEEIDQFPYERKVPADGVLDISQNGTSPVYLSVSSTYWDCPVKAKGTGFSIQTSFSDTVLTVSQRVKMKVTVTVEKDADYVLIHVPIPAGCTYASKDRSWKNNEVYREHYKEHTNIFCSALTRGVYEFTIELTPFCQGEYTLNPAKVEQMYFPEFNACTEMKKVKIGREK